MIRRVFYMLKAKPLHSVLAVLLFLLVSTAMSIAVLLSFAAGDAKDKILQEIGIEVLIYQKDPNHPDRITDAMLASIQTLPHIVGVDILQTLPVLPMDFENDKTYTGIDPATQKGGMEDGAEEGQDRKDEMNFHGCYDIQQEEYFRRGYNRLLEGEMPKTGRKEVLISRQVAEANSISVGSTLRFQIPAYFQPYVSASEVQVTVSGIYETDLQFEILDTNFMGENVFAVSPQNTVYTTLDLVEEVETGTVGNGYESVSLLVDSPLHADAVLDQILSTPGFEAYTGLNSADVMMNQFAASLQSLTASSQNATVAVFWFGTLFVVLFSTLWINGYKRETGILLALGYTKRRIRIMVCLEICMLSAIAALLSVPISFFAANAYASGLHLAWSDANLVSSVDLGVAQNIVIPFEIRLNGVSLSAQILTAAGVVLCSMITPLIVVHKYEIREIFH